MVETWELSHIRKGLEKVRKPKILERIKFIKDNHTSEICNYYGYVNFRKNLVYENGDKLFTDEEFIMIETWQPS